MILAARCARCKRYQDITEWPYRGTKYTNGYHDKSFNSIIWDGRVGNYFFCGPVEVREQLIMMERA